MTFNLFQKQKLVIASGTTACTNCGKNPISLVDSETGYPLYYHGAGPSKPQDATEYFCNAECASVWYKKNKIGSHKYM